MKISMIGTGYVGLTTGVCFAHLGHHVICQDIDEKKIQKLKNNENVIYEPDLDAFIHNGLKSGNLEFTHDMAKAVQQSDIIFICVNTPPKPDGHADLKYVEQVARDIAKHMNGYKVIIDKSTVPIRTAEKVKETINKYSKGDFKFDIVSNPEFLREGHAVYDILHPNRIVIGVENARSRDMMLELYTSFQNTPIKITSIKSAELIKHGANTFLATKISFANLIAEVCESAGANAKEVLEAIGLDERIGKYFLNPGIGFGGSCFPKDIKAFKKTLEIFGINHSLIDSIEDINNRAVDRFIKKIEKELWVLDGKRIAVLGLAFKPNTDDIRNSPAIKIIDALKKEGAKICAHDPKAMEKAKEIFNDIDYADNFYECVRGCDALVLCTEWDEYKKIDFNELKKLLITPIIFDGRNIIDKKIASDNGFVYFGIGG